MPIVNMTRGSIEFRLGDKVAMIDGELLAPEGDRQHFVVYAASMKRWLAPYDAELIGVDEKRRIVDSIRMELSPDKVHVEIDDEEEALGGRSIGTRRVAGGDPCPQSGFWFTPARQSSRRYFFQGEAMPVVGGDYGVTVWQWDADQATPDSSFVGATG
jgi:Immunity protein 74